MNYAQLFRLLGDLLKGHPHGWAAIRHSPGPRGGVYMWPAAAGRLLEQHHALADARLGEYSILFEFHITQNDYARILARARFNGNRPRWNQWRRLAIDDCHADPPRQVLGAATRSLARWDGGALEQIHFLDAPELAAKTIVEYLRSPPRSLDCFIKRFARRHPNSKQ